MQIPYQRCQVLQASPIFWMIALLLLAACGGISDSTTSDTVSGAGTLNAALAATIEQPQTGTVIYAETITLSGQAQADFELVLVDTEENVIAERTITPQNGTWRVELVHGYMGEPTEVMIRATRADETLQTASILLSDISQRPDGAYGLIIIPADGTEVGGDAFLSEGRASGADRLMIELTGDDGTILHSSQINLNNPERINEVPWQAEVQVGDYVGQGVLRIYTVDEDGVETTLDSTRFTILMAAG